MEQWSTKFDELRGSMKRDVEKTVCLLTGVHMHTCVHINMARVQQQNKHE